MAEEWKEMWVWNVFDYIRENTHTPTYLSGCLQ